MEEGEQEMVLLVQLGGQFDLDLQRQRSSVKQPLQQLLPSRKPTNTQDGTTVIRSKDESERSFARTLTVVLKVQLRIFFHLFAICVFIFNNKAVT